MRNILSLKNTKEFGRVFEQGKPIGNRYLVMYIAKNDCGRNRLGISVSKKVGNSVVRHRFCRLVRESFRLNESKFNSGLDIVVVARKSAADCGFHEIESAFLHLAGKHRIMKSPDKS